MRVLVVGSGAREDALAWRLLESPSCDAIFAAPGNAGTAQRGTNWNLAATDGIALARRCADERIDLAVLGPETAVAAGVGDRLRAAGVAVFGPSRSAGRLESSKIFAKRFMERHGVPTARASVAHSLTSALRALDHYGEAVAIKADGLAAGKGVVVANDRSVAKATLEEWYAGRLPGGGSDILIEERLSGREVSVFAMSDGERFVPFGAACDYKRAGDGDSGPNTGGMGAYSPPNGLPDDFEALVRERILAPVRRGLEAEGERYVGVLYCGLMWTDDGPRVIEFNARFGDPEAQVLLPRFDGDLAEVFSRAANGTLDENGFAFSPDACVGVVLASAGYPRSATPLCAIPARIDLPDACSLFWGTSTIGESGVDAAGGRVMTVVATAPDVCAARTRVYDCVRALSERLGAFNLTYRTDIAAL